MKLTDGKDNRNVNDDHDLTEQEQDQIPAYLLTTNKSFDRMIQKVMNTASAIDMNDLRRMALLMHQIAALHIQKQITIAYLRCGTGQLREPEMSLTVIDRRVWPAQVKSAMLEKRHKAKTDTIVQINARDEHRSCENLVYEHLRKIKRKTEQYQKQFNEKKSQLIGLTSTMEEAIVRYVQQYGIIPLQMKRDLKIALLEHEYDAEILERKYAAEKPNEYQVRKCTFC